MQESWAFPKLNILGLFLAVCLSACNSKVAVPIIAPSLTDETIETIPTTIFPSHTPPTPLTSMPTPMRATATPTPLSLPIATQLPSSTQRIEFDIANFLTYTPAPPALCPEFLSDAVPVPSFMDPEEPWTIYEEI